MHLESSSRFTRDECIAKESRVRDCKGEGPRRTEIRSLKKLSWSGHPLEVIALRANEARTGGGARVVGHSCATGPG